MSDWDFTRKVALVTGASQGIGAGIVTALASRGARCGVNYFNDAAGRNQSTAQALASQLPNAIVLSCDVADSTQVNSMMERVRAECGGLDILVNNAGIHMENEIHKMTDEQWNAVMDVNLKGAFHCIRAAVPLLRDSGRIVNIASVSGQMGFFTQANYASSKAGLIALTKVVARELASKGITANAIAPGFIKTAMTEDLPADAVKTLLQNLPLGSFGEIADIVNAVLFLCSPDAKYITGQVLNVNGGLYM